MENREDPYETGTSEQSELGEHCLIRYVRPNIQGKNGTHFQECHNIMDESSKFPKS